MWHPHFGRKKLLEGAGCAFGKCHPHGGKLWERIEITAVKRLSVAHFETSLLTRYSLMGTPARLMDGSIQEEEWEAQKGASQLR